MTKASTPARPPGRPRSAEADAAIVEAALDLFIERGLDGTSIEQIAKRAGVGKLTVYRRWASKEDLIARAIESSRDSLVDATADELATADLDKLVEDSLPAQAAVLAQPRFRALLARVFGCAVDHPTLLETYWETYVRPRRRLAEALLERAVHDGRIPATADLEVRLDMMVGGILYRLLQPGPLDEATMRHHLEEVYEQAGVLRRPRSAERS